MKKEDVLIRLKNIRFKLVLKRNFFLLVLKKDVEIKRFFIEFAAFNFVFYLYI